MPYSWWFESLSQWCVREVVVLIVASGQQVQCALAVTGFDVRGVINRYIAKKRAARCILVQQPRAVGGACFDGLAAAYAAAKAHEDQISPGVAGRTSVDVATNGAASSGAAKAGVRSRVLRVRQAAARWLTSGV